MLSINFSPFPVLHTNRLLLKRIEQEDADDIFSLRSDANAMQYIPRPIMQSVNEAPEFIQKLEGWEKANEAINWGISLKPHKNLIGSICLWNISKENYRAEIGYMLRSEFHGNKIMQEAIEAVIHYGFKNMKLHSIEAKVDPANVASIKLLKRNNFIKEGYLKENGFFNGKFFDTVIYTFISPYGSEPA